MNFSKLQESLTSINFPDFENLTGKVSETSKSEKVVSFKIRLSMIVPVKSISLISVS